MTILGTITPTEDINGTSYQGVIVTTYAELVAALGEPHYNDGDKTTAEWDFVTDKGIVFTIYDYKEDSTPLFEYEWHIGGMDQQVIDAVKMIFPAKKVEVK